MIGEFFRNILTYPLLNLLVFFYNYIPDIGIVIILLTVLTRLLLLPSFHKGMKHQKELQDLQPKMNEIKQKYKDDKERQAKALMELYSVHKVNPLSSCLPVLIQLPILIALYQVFIKALGGQALEGLYPFVPNPGAINVVFLGFLNLAQKNVILAGLAAVLQYFQSKMMLSKKQASQDPTAKMMSIQTLYVLPGLTFIFGLQFPAGLTLYWAASTLFGIVQQYYFLKKEARVLIESK
ncbi:MAG: membrane protein insertase YidC [Candidatus Doudnabacteria bacterium]|nr:membrane protein insertase YidC [Candidatus Doudnabacteria bacterium]